MLGVSSIKHLNYNIIEKINSIPAITAPTARIRTAKFFMMKQVNLNKGSVNFKETVLRMISIPRNESHFIPLLNNWRYVHECAYPMPYKYRCTCHRSAKPIKPNPDVIIWVKSIMHLLNCIHMYLCTYDLFIYRIMQASAIDQTNK